MNPESLRADLLHNKAVGIEWLASWADVYRFAMRSGGFEDISSLDRNRRINAGAGEQIGDKILNERWERFRVDRE